MLFATTSLARRIERAECTLMTELVGAVAARLNDDSVLCRSIAGGVAIYAGAGSPMNKVAGLGFETPPDTATLDDLEREYCQRNAHVRVELSSLGHGEIATLLTRRGYDLVGFENVMGLALDERSLASLADHPRDERLRVSRAEPHEVTDWMETLVTGFLAPDVFDGPPPTEQFDRAAMEQALGNVAASQGFERFLARHDGALAGSAGLRLHDGIAQLCGAATLPTHRRRGVQSALLHDRLTTAAARGCDLAIVTTEPASKSQENVQRVGFTLLYVRAILVKATSANTSR